VGPKAYACVGAQFDRSVLFSFNQRDLSTTFEVTHKSNLFPINIKCKGPVSDEAQ
jgi:hypothetical protein